MPIEKEDMKNMMGSVCPTCKMPMWKNGKKTHSRAKAIVCEAKFREKVKVFPDEQFVIVDGKRYQIDANFKRTPKK
jgi:hypothetical protein